MLTPSALVDNPSERRAAMPIATVAIDLAKDVFELAAADETGKIIERRRLTRCALERYLEGLQEVHIVMEACGTAHYWARRLGTMKLRVSLLPPHYVRPYVRRNKTDGADALALLEASRAGDIFPVRVKSTEQQGLQGLHRVRSAWIATRIARINMLRGLCREFGISVPVGAKRGLAALRQNLAEVSPVPSGLRNMMLQVFKELDEIDGRLTELEGRLREVASQSDVCRRLQTIPGIGLITSTAFAGAVGDISIFKCCRRFSSWLGLTPRERSSGSVRRLGTITKRGDAYLRMLLVHGARAVLYSADAARRAGRPLDALREWSLRVRARAGHNRAAVAVANKLARILWATWRHQRDFDGRSSQSVAA
jgi:transposase